MILSYKIIYFYDQTVGKEVRFNTIQLMENAYRWVSGVWQTSRILQCTARHQQVLLKHTFGLQAISDHFNMKL